MHEIITQDLRADRPNRHVPDVLIALDYTCIRAEMKINELARQTIFGELPHFFECSEYNCSSWLLQTYAAMFNFLLRR